MFCKPVSKVEFGHDTAIEVIKDDKNNINSAQGYQYITYLGLTVPLFCDLDLYNMWAII